MTNGEKFKQIFSITQVDEGELYAFAWLPNHNAAEFSIDWWNAEYKEPKPGHWIPTYGNVKCSVCGSVKDSREVGKATHYCDFCGARMVEPQGGEKI